MSQVQYAPDAIAYLRYADFEANDGKLQSVPIVNAQGAAVPATRASIEDATYELSRPIFLYVNANSADSKEVEAFIEFYLQRGAGAIQEAKFTPLAARASKKALQNFRDRKIGTVFADLPVRGVPVDQILDHEAKRFSL